MARNLVLFSDDDIEPDDIAMANTFLDAAYVSSRYI